LNYEQLAPSWRRYSAESNNDNEGAAQKLAATQARLLKQLMRTNLRLQRRIDEVLDSQQRKKLDALRRTSEVTVGEGNQR
jgi:hypothetical protein